MAAPFLKNTDLKFPPQRRRGSVRVATTGDHAAPSPALNRQAMVQDQWLEGRDAVEARWPIRRTITIVALSCGGFWGVVFWGLAQLAR